MWVMVDLWTEGAAIGTSLGALFVAWQAFETRRATNATRRALSASEAVALDAARARMDEGVPRVHVFVDSVDWPPLEPSVISSFGGKDQPLEPGRQWHFPRDANQMVVLRIRLQVENLENRKILLRYRGPIGPVTNETPGTLPGTLLYEEKTDYLWVRAVFPVADWAKNWQAHSSGRELSVFADVEIDCLDDRDQGVVDTWRLRLSGWPIEPVPNRDALWRITQVQADRTFPPCVQFDQRPLYRREYWLSQSQGVLLPKPSYTPPISVLRSLLTWSKQLQSDSGDGFEKLGARAEASRLPVLFNGGVHPFGQGPSPHSCSCRRRFPGNAQPAHGPLPPCRTPTTSTGRLHRPRTSEPSKALPPRPIRVRTCGHPRR
jgi:hypothetical protein